MSKVTSVQFLLLPGKNRVWYGDYIYGKSLCDKCIGKEITNKLRSNLKDLLANQLSCKVLTNGVEVHGSKLVVTCKHMSRKRVDNYENAGVDKLMYIFCYSDLPEIEDQIEFEGIMNRAYSGKTVMISENWNKIKDFAYNYLHNKFYNKEFKINIRQTSLDTIELYATLD